MFSVCRVCVSLFFFSLSTHIFLLLSLSPSLSLLSLSLLPSLFLLSFSLLLSHSLSFFLSPLSLSLSLSLSFFFSFPAYFLLFLSFVQVIALVLAEKEFSLYHAIKPKEFFDKLTFQLPPGETAPNPKTPGLNSLINWVNQVINYTSNNKAKQSKAKQNKTKQNKTKQNKTKQNKTKQNKTKQSKAKKIFFSFIKKNIYV